jgi:hypothetical protein
VAKVELAVVVAVAELDFQVTPAILELLVQQVMPVHQATLEVLAMLVE